MAKNYKPDEFYYGNYLDQEIALSKKSGWLYFEDGTKYSPQELELIEKAGGVLDKATHMIKKTFNGELVDVKQSTRETIETGQRASAINNKNSGEKIPGVNGACPANRQGELEIF